MWQRVALVGWIAVAGCATGTGVEARADEVLPAAAPEATAEPTLRLSSFVWEQGEHGVLEVTGPRGPLELRAVSWQGVVVFTASLPPSSAPARAAITVTEPGYYRLLASGGGDERKLAFVVFPPNAPAVPREVAR